MTKQKDGLEELAKILVKGTIIDYSPEGRIRQYKEFKKNDLTMGVLSGLTAIITTALAVKTDSYLLLAAPTALATYFTGTSLRNWYYLDQKVEDIRDGIDADTTSYRRLQNKNNQEV